MFVLFRSGGDLLSHVLRRSTIIAAALNGRVRMDRVFHGCYGHHQKKKTISKFCTKTIGVLRDF